MPTDNFTFRFYKYSGEKIKCCKIPVGESVFVENIERRLIRMSVVVSIDKIKTYRIGYITLTNGKTYIVYQFPPEIIWCFKKRENELFMLPNKYDSLTIQNKIASMGSWPDTIERQEQQQQQQEQQQQQQEQQQQEQQQQPISKPLPPTHVCNLLLEDAINKKDICPILYDTLTRENAIVTSCFHVFSRTGFVNWCKTSNTCPICREQCISTL
jgi:hypothetical protein